MEKFLTYYLRGPVRENRWLPRLVVVPSRSPQESALAAEAVAALAETVRGCPLRGAQRRRVAGVEYLAQRVAAAG